MNLVDIKKLSETLTSRQLEQKISKEFADRPKGLLQAHGMAARVVRMKSENGVCPAIKKKVDEILKLNPKMNLHVAYRLAGRALGIIE